MFPDEGSRVLCKLNTDLESHQPRGVLRSCVAPDSPPTLSEHGTSPAALWRGPCIQRCLAAPGPASSLLLGQVPCENCPVSVPLSTWKEEKELFFLPVCFPPPHVAGREAGSETEFSVGFRWPCWAGLLPAGARLR